MAKIYDSPLPRPLLSDIISSLENDDQPVSKLKEAYNRINNSKIPIEILNSTVIIFDLADFSLIKSTLDKGDFSNHGLGRALHSYESRKLFKFVCTAIWKRDITELTSLINQNFGSIFKFYEEIQVPYLSRFLGDGYCLIFPFKYRESMISRQEESTFRDIDVGDKYKQKTNKALIEEIFRNAYTLLTEHCKENLPILERKARESSKDYKNRIITDYRELSCTIVKGEQCHLISNITQSDTYHYDIDANETILGLGTATPNRERSSDEIRQWKNSFEFAGNTLDLAFRINKLSGGFFIACNDICYEELIEVNPDNKKIFSFLDRGCVVSNSYLKGVFGITGGHTDEQVLRIDLVEEGLRGFDIRYKLHEYKKLLSIKVQTLYLKSRIKSYESKKNKKKKSKYLIWPNNIENNSSFPKKYDFE